MNNPILSSACVARSVNAADSRMVNLFLEAVPEGGKNEPFNWCGKYAPEKCALEKKVSK